MTDVAANKVTSTEYAHGISFSEAFVVWLRVATLSFGGPAGQIAVMHRILVEEKNWISENRFLHALNYCMLLPGPEAQQLATYIGWLLHRTAGGIMAGGLFILPGIICIMALSYIYAAFGKVGFIEALFFGLKAAVLAIVIQAVVRVGKRALRDRICRRQDRTAGIFGHGARRRQECRGSRQHARRGIAGPCTPHRSACAESQRGVAITVAGAGRRVADRV